MMTIFSQFLAAQLGSLSAEDLGTFGFSGFPDMDALPTPPLITISFEAGSECYRYFHQITNIIFLHAPIGFHDPVSGRTPHE